MDLLNQIIQQTTAVGATALPVSFPLSGNFENRPTGLSQSNVDCWNHFGSVYAQPNQVFYFSSESISNLNLEKAPHNVCPHTPLPSFYARGKHGGGIIINTNVASADSFVAHY